VDWEAIECKAARDFFVEPNQITQKCWRNNPWQSGPKWHSRGRAGLRTCKIVKTEFTETLKKRVGGSLCNVPILSRLEMLRANARVLTKQPEWKQPPDDGTFVRKTVGASR